MSKAEGDEEKIEKMAMRVERRGRKVEEEEEQQQQQQQGEPGDDLR